MSNDYYIEPRQWEQQWEPERIKVLKPLIADFRYRFSEHDIEAFFILVYRKKNAYISMGLRKQDLQSNGNHHSIVFAFGFFYDNISKFTPRYLDGVVERGAIEYQRFLDGEWPLNKIFDQDVVDRVTQIEEDPLS